MNISPGGSPSSRAAAAAGGRSVRDAAARHASQQQQQLQPAEAAQLLPLRAPGGVAALSTSSSSTSTWPPPPKWLPALQQAASQRAAVAVYVVLAVALVWFVAAGGVSGSSSSSSVSSSGSAATIGSLDSTIPGASAVPAAADSSTKSSAGDGKSRAAAAPQPPVRCPYGSLPGTWVSSAPAGAKWQVLDPDCQLKNWLAAYAAAAAAGNSSSADAAAGLQKQLPEVRMLMLSDSVDRYVMQHVCDYLGGSKHTLRMPADHSAEQQQQPPTAAASAVSGESPPPAAAGAGADSTVGASAAQAPPLAVAAAAAAATPSPLNATAYAFHTCEFGPGVPLKLASSYFPGVHPTGPFHRGLAQNFTVRIEAAASMWDTYAGHDAPPHAVSVASALWDVARLWTHERGWLEGREELDRPLLDAWVANFSSVANFSRARLPATELWLTHTTMLPAHDVASGLMRKPYLGRRYFISQLNAAAATAARRLGLQLVDYAALADRFAERQAHLTDLIHPNAEVALEVFNVLLNLVLAGRSSSSSSDDRHHR